MPLNAVRTDKPAPYVQVVAGDRIAHRPVGLGARGSVDGEPWVAVRGLDDGVTVLRGSAGVLREGTATRPAAAPAATASASAAANAGRP